MDVLLSSDVAREFHGVNSAREFGSARELVDCITAFMSQRLPGSRIDPLDVASAVLELREQLATPEQAALQHDQVQGIGDPDRELAEQRMNDLSLAGRVSQMDSAAYAEFRRQAGMERDLMSFLGRE